ncbi:MAG TPA: prolyl oligopeptidase family serine peptidase, partial [Armatimonadota bacterium]|nr:prolyl oligopeptidase family serine peptidase [Armatimonadota bacterium]
MYVRLLVIYTLLALCCAVMAQEDGLVAAIPRLTGITIDGDSADWGDRGFRIDQLLPWGGPSVRARLTTVADHDAQVRLGWDDAGLLVLVTVRDDVWVEEAEVSQLGRYDALEVYLSPERGSPEILQWVIGPGMTPEQPALRWHLYDYRTAEELLAIPAAPEAARRTIAGGLRVELRLPWAALGITPAVGREAAFQFWSHDVDDPKETVTHVLPWYPTLGAFRNSKLMHRIRLSDAAGPAIVARAVGDCDMAALLPRVTVLAPATQGGMPVQVRQGKHVLVQGALAVDEAGRASATLLLPRAARQPFAHLQVVVGETVVDTVSYPYAHRLAAIARLREQQEAVRAYFRLDHPEETLADAPAAVRRHRGLAALALRWLEPGFWATEEQQLRALGEVADIVDVLKGRDILGGRRGAFWEGYYSLADGSGQPFVTVLPEGYTPRKTYPLIIYLHGMGVRLMPHYEAPLQEPYIIVRAWGRGDTFYNGLGEDDILQVLAHMRRWYRIDPDRVYLLGESMGGTGIWHIAARHPDLFAAVAPYFGVPSNVPLANLRNLPVLNQHGAQDWTVAVDYSRYGVSHLQQWGYPVLYREFPEAGHALPYAPAYAWLPTFRRVRRPEAVTLTTEVPGGLYWLRVEEMADPHRQCDVTARVVGAGRQQAVMLEAPNAAAIALDAAAMPLDRKAPLQIQVDGQALTQPAPLPERLYLRQHDGAWTLATHRAPTPSPVRPYRAGAGADLFAGEPLMIVYGTRGGAARAALLQEAAERMRLLAGERMMIVGGWPVKADRDVAEADLARCNLILIG